MKITTESIVSWIGGFFCSQFAVGLLGATVRLCFDSVVLLITGSRVHPAATSARLVLAQSACVLVVYVLAFVPARRYFNKTVTDNFLLSGLATGYLVAALYTSIVLPTGAILFSRGFSGID